MSVKLIIKIFFRRALKGGALSPPTLQYSSPNFVAPARTFLLQPELCCSSPNFATPAGTYLPQLELICSSPNPLSLQPELLCPHPGHIYPPARTSLIPAPLSFHSSPNCFTAWPELPYSPARTAMRQSPNRFYSPARSSLLPSPDFFSLQPERLYSPALNFFPLKPKLLLFSPKLDHLGVLLPRRVSSHGQLYVALGKVRGRDKALFLRPGCKRGCK
jgi:hypothetical protein